MRSNRSSSRLNLSSQAKGFRRKFHFPPDLVAYLRAADNVSGPLPIPLGGAISRSCARATGVQDLVPSCCPAWAHKSGVELDEHQPTPLFILSVAGATAAPERVTRLAATTPGRLIPLPSPVYTAATPWPSP